MEWTIVDFGKYQGLTLPQILWEDPGYVLWARRHQIFDDDLAQEAELLVGRARRIQIPKRQPRKWRVEHRFIDAEMRYDGFRLVRAREPERAGDRIWRRRDEHFDLFVASEYNEFDRRGVEKLLCGVGHYCFGSPGVKLTQTRCGGFFNNQENFVLPSLRTAGLLD
jgi:hypothetical protein